jgi:hypothetical protein
LGRAEIVRRSRGRGQLRRQAASLRFARFQALVDSVLRRARNLCLGALLEAVRDRTKTVDLKQVNRVLLQQHWRKEVDLPQ